MKKKKKENNKEEAIYPGGWSSIIHWHFYSGPQEKNLDLCKIYYCMTSKP